jgi:hypothetical protein
MGAGGHRYRGAIRGGGGGVGRKCGGELWDRGFILVKVS